MSATAIRRYRLDDLRRFAVALGCASGLAPPRALSLASHLLWFDAAGAASFGIETLPGWLEKIETGSIDLAAPGKITAEWPALALLDGQNGIAPLILEHAAELAIEKARDTAVGLVRITHLGGLGSAAAVVAAIAIRPMAGLVLGPGKSWSVALPSRAGLPVIFDSGLAATESGRTLAPSGARSGRHGGPAKASPPHSCFLPFDGAGNWSDVLVPADSWLVAALALADLEPLAEFHDRVGQWIQGIADGPGRLLPSTWADRRSEAHERGIPIGASVWKQLKHWADRFAMVAPTPGTS